MQATWTFDYFTETEEGVHTARVHDGPDKTYSVGLMVTVNADQEVLIYREKWNKIPREVWTRIDQWVREIWDLQDARAAQERIKSVNQAVSQIFDPDHSGEVR